MVCRWWVRRAAWTGSLCDSGCLNSMRRAMLKQVQIKPVDSNSLRGILISATAGYDDRLK